MQIQPGNDQLCGTIPSSVQALNVTFETSYGAQLYTCAPADPRHDAAHCVAYSELLPCPLQQGWLPGAGLGVWLQIDERLAQVQFT